MKKCFFLGFFIVFVSFLFYNAPIRRIAVAIKTSSAVAGSFHENPLNNHEFHVRERRTIRGGRAIVPLNTISHCRSHVTTVKEM